MQDIFGEYQRYFTFIKKVARHEFRKSGFTRISTPVLEKLELVSSGMGLDPENATKNMYLLEDKKWRKLVLKSESTVWVMRSYLESFLEYPQPVYLYYIEPHFRRELKWMNQHNQFHQIGAEIIGEVDPVLDAKMIYIAHSILENIGLKWKFTLKINSLGNKKEREKFIIELLSFFENKKQHLSPEDLECLEKNPIQILTSENPDTKQLLAFAPKITDFIKKDSLEFYNKMKEYLDVLGMKYEEDPLLTNDFWYYGHTVWSFVDSHEWISGRVIGGGWRYDDLSKNIGHKDMVPGVGFALSVENMIDSMMRENITLKNKDQIHLYFIQLGDEATKLTLPLNIEARNRGLNSLLSLWTPSIKIQMKKAIQLGAKFVAIIGIMEAKTRVCQLKNIVNGTQVEVKLDNLLDHVVADIWTEGLDFYSPSRDFIIETPKIAQ